MVSSSFFKRKGINEIKEVLNLAKSKDSNINHVTSDGFHAYKYSVKRISIATIEHLLIKL